LVIIYLWFVLFLYFQDSGSNPAAQMADPLPGPQPGSSRGVVRPAPTQLSKAMKKKRVEGAETDTETEPLSERTSTELLALLRSALDNPSTETTAITSLAAFGQWLADVSTGLHPSLEKEWTDEVCKTYAYLCLQISCPATMSIHVLQRHMISVFELVLCSSTK